MKRPRFLIAGGAPALSILAIFLAACAEYDPCEPLGGCVTDAGLVVGRPEIIWERARQHFSEGELLGPYDTVPVRVRVENHAREYSPKAEIVLRSQLNTFVDSLPPMPPLSFRIVEFQYHLPAYTFRSEDLLTVDIHFADGVVTGPTVLEGATTVPLLGSGFAIRLVELPAELRTGVPATARVRIVNTFDVPVPADSILSCIFDQDYCPAQLPTTPTSAIAPGDSADFTVDVTPPVFAFHYWYERLENVSLRHCVAGMIGPHCVESRVVIFPNFPLTCPPEGNVTPPAVIDDDGFDCTTLGQQEGSLYTFDAVAGQRYRAERLSGDGPGVAISDENGVAWNALTPVFDFTAAQTRRYYLIMRHTGPITVRISALP